MGYSGDSSFVFFAVYIPTAISLITFEEILLCVCHRTNACKIIAEMINNGQVSLYDENKWPEDCISKHFRNIIKMRVFVTTILAIGSVFFFFFRHRYNTSRPRDKNLCRAKKIRKNSAILKYEIVEHRTWGDENCDRIRNHKLVKRTARCFITHPFSGLISVCECTYNLERALHGRLLLEPQHWNAIEAIRFRWRRLSFCTNHGWLNIYSRWGVR